MRVISFVGIKGGIGKTSLAKEFIEKLKRELTHRGSKKKILVLDLDHQCNLTQAHGLYESEGTVVNIFKRQGDVVIHHIDEQLDMIAGAMDLDVIESELETKTFKDMLLYMWLDKNYDDIDADQYEYVVIDCRPDFSIATRNAVAISDMLLSPIIPSQYSLDSRQNLETRLQMYADENIDYKTGESNIDAELYFLGNMIKHNTLASKELVKQLENDSKVLGFVPYKELFIRATIADSENGVQPSVYDLIEKDEYNGIRLSDHRHFFYELDGVLNKVLLKLDSIAV
jgi:chromosome partitioning protein